MRLSRDFLLVILAIVASGCVAGCGPTVAAPATPRGGEPEVQMQPLTAQQLAAILGVNVWTAKFSGGPIDCWLEVEEQGQSTMPKRIPEKDYIGVQSDHSAPTEGTITIWWRQQESGAGGNLMIQAANGSIGYGLNKDAFTFGWPGFNSRSTAAGSGQPIKAEPGKEFVLVDYDAQESRPAGDSKPPRRVHLKLMGRFAGKK